VCILAVGGKVDIVAVLEKAGIAAVSILRLSTFLKVLTCRTAVDLC